MKQEKKRQQEMHPIDVLLQAHDTLRAIVKSDLTAVEEAAVFLIINDAFSVCQTLIEESPSLCQEAINLHRQFWFVAADLERHTAHRFEYIGELWGFKLERRPIFRLV